MGGMMGGGGGMMGGGPPGGGGPGGLPGVSDAGPQDSNRMAQQMLMQAAQAAGRGDVAETMQLIKQAMQVLLAGQGPAGPAAPTPKAPIPGGGA